MKKKITLLMAIVLIVAVAVCLVACDNSETEQTDTTANITTDTNTNTTTYTAVTAYEIAVKHGFVGTEEDWLASLKGENAQASFTISDLYEAAVEAGFTGDFLDFVREYFSGEDTTIDNTYATSKAILSAVTIKSKFTISTYNYWSRRYEESQATSGGAGVIYKLDKVNGDAYIITNFHVVYNASSTNSNHLSEDVTVYLYGSEYTDMGISATVVGGSAYYDIAVLKVTNSERLRNSDARAAEISEEDVTVGQTAIAIGYPEAETMSVSAGVVRVDSQKITVAVDGVNNYELRAMGVDAAINSGNSGGGIFDANGKLIGIVNARYNSSSVEDMGYGIPVYIATSVADNVIYNCNGTTSVAVKKCTIGVTTQISDSYMSYNETTGKTSVVEKITVAELTGGGLAESVLQDGDELISLTLNGTTKAVTRNYMLGELLLNARPGDTLTIKFTRGGAEMTADIVLTAESFADSYVK